jgi:hypothetical protein
MDWEVIATILPGGAAICGMVYVLSLYRYICDSGRRVECAPNPFSAKVSTMSPV